MLNQMKWLASTKLTVLFILLLLIVIMIAHYGELSYTYWLSLPLALLVINLVAAILTNKAFQASVPLLFFHLTLLATVVLMALSRLTYLDGHIGLDEGEVFSGQLDNMRHGPLHNYTLAEGDFINQAVQLDLTPQVAVTAVRARAQVRDRQGYHEEVFGEHKPLIVKGYRLYVTRNVGYSAEFTWHDFRDNGKTSTGTLNFPPFLFFQFSQTTDWTIPDTDIDLWVMLSPEEDQLAEAKPIQLTPPDSHHLVVRIGEERYELKAGQQLKLSQGALTYHGLRTWIGFSVHYDPFKAYLLASSILTVLFLSWFFWQKFSRRSWLTPENE